MTETRRNILRSIGLGIGASLGPIRVVSAATDSGNVELTTNATLPTNTSIDITVYEDTSKNVSANRNVSQSIDGGTNTYELSTLEGTESGAPNYWLDVELQTTDDTVTPELDSVEIAVPREAEQDQEDFSLLFPERLTTTLAVLIGGILFALTWIATSLRSPLGIMTVAVAGIVFISTFLLGIPFIWFWIAVLLCTVVLALAGFVQSI